MRFRTSSPARAHAGRAAARVAAYRPSLALLVLLVACVARPPTALARELRVCSDPNNLPFSNARGEGCENRIAELLAESLGAELRYTWWAQRRGFIRNTLRRASAT